MGRRTGKVRAVYSTTLKEYLNWERRKADLNFVHMRAQKKLNAMDTVEPGKHTIQPTSAT